jgi:ABC-2 type transport system permease protein
VNWQFETPLILQGLSNGSENMKGSIGRIGAMTMRYWFLIQSSWPRLLELIYWPTMHMIVWGFLQIYLYHDGESSRGPTGVPLSGVLIGSVLLWDVLFRGQLGFSFSFLEEMWSRNIANLMMSPLRPFELAASLMAVSLIRLLVSMGPVTLLAYVLFSFNIYVVGLPLAVLFVNLVVTGWAIGLFISGLVLRNGLGAESFAWSLMFLLLPLCCVYYPVWVLPAWLQPVSWCLAPTYVFEALRAALYDGVFRADLMVEAFVLNLVYLALAFWGFIRLLDGARENGVLLAQGE